MGRELTLETNAQLAEPRVRELDPPAMAPEALTALDAAPSDAGLDAALA